MMEQTDQEFAEIERRWAQPPDEPYRGDEDEQDEEDGDDA